MEKIITDNASESIKLKWDGTRFSIICDYKDCKPPSFNVIVLNPKEMLDVILAACKMMEDKDA